MNENYFTYFLYGPDPVIYYYYYYYCYYYYYIIEKDLNFTKKI